MVKNRDLLEGLFFTAARNIAHLTLMLTTIYWNDWKSDNLPAVLPFVHTTETVHSRSNGIQLWNQVLKICFPEEYESIFNCRYIFLSVESLASFPILCKAKPPLHPLTQGMLL